MNIIPASKDQSSTIATLIMEAMNHECCQYFAGEHHTLADFHRMMTKLVGREDSQYSYLNTLVAIDESGEVMGCCVAYDGGKLRQLRQAFLEEAREELEMDHSGMADETQAGEYYIDSICVDSRFRGKGVASALLQAMADKALREGFHTVGLLVDKENPRAEKLYTRVGFRYVNDASWGGHSLKRMTLQQ